MKITTALFSRLISLVSCTLCLVGSRALTTASAQSASHTDTARHMPQGAFLRSPSPDVAQLVQQVKADPAVAIRYSRLFHLPVKMVPLAFAQMRQKKLTADHVMQVHYIKGVGTGREELVYKMRRVRAGTPVYCLPDGTPILVRVCGNPIRTRVSPEFYTNAPVPNFNSHEILLPRPTVDSSTAFTTDIPRATPFPDVPLPILTVIPATDVLPVTLVPVAPALPPAALRAASLPPVYNWAHTPGSFFGLGGLPALGLLSLLDMSHHGSVAPVTPIGPQPIIPPTTPTTPTLPIVPLLPVTSVPEPGAVGTGLVVLMSLSLALRFRQRRR